jgi:S1 RNA binding domain
VVVALKEVLKVEAAIFMARRALDLVSPSEIIAWAAKELAESNDSKNFAELAGLGTNEEARVDDILDGLLVELGLHRPTAAQVALLCASHIAWQLSQGELEPIDAARDIWRIAFLAPEGRKELSKFIGLASEWDDDPSGRSYYDEEIRSLALTLSTNTNFGTEAYPTAVAVRMDVAPVSTQRPRLVSGRVTRHEPYGFYVDIGEAQDGLVVISMIADESDIANPTFPSIGSVVIASLMRFTEIGDQPRLSVRPKDITRLTEE